MDVLRDDQDVVVSPVQSHGAGDVLIAVGGRLGRVPPGHVELLREVFKNSSSIDKWNPLINFYPNHPLVP